MPRQQQINKDDNKYNMLRRVNANGESTDIEGPEEGAIVENESNGNDKNVEVDGVEQGNDSKDRTSKQNDEGTLALGNLTPIEESPEEEKSEIEPELNEFSCEFVPGTQEIVQQREAHQLALLEKDVGIMEYNICENNRRKSLGDLVIPNENEGIGGDVLEPNPIMLTVEDSDIRACTIEEKRVLMSDLEIDSRELEDNPGTGTKSKNKKTKQPRGDGLTRNTRSSSKK